MRGQLILSLVMLMTYIVHVSFAVVMEGKCPRLAAVHVTEEMFSGRWFELLRSRADVKYNEIPTTCTVEEFSFTTYKSSRWTLHINSTGFDGQQFTSNVVEAPQKVARRSNVGSFSIDHKIPTRTKNSPPNFIVLYLDREFSIVYFCEEFANLKIQVAWILSRTRHPRISDVEIMERKLKSFKLDLDMVPIDQYDCPEHHFEGSERVDAPENKKHRFLSLLQNEPERKLMQENNMRQLMAAKLQSCVMKAGSLTEMHKCYDRVALWGKRG
ncbi:uncharacterized protein LOC134840151 isoform X2 [Symsagittifera roscoffensis]|uniref:uncharacterized protein LOC134840151 isoform X2 n=1 Tax=Symsagittifera roscoffensis TaxID=84072 RepID=UPI00307C6A60